MEAFSSLPARPLLALSRTLRRPSLAAPYRHLLRPRQAFPRCVSSLLRPLHPRSHSSRLSCLPASGGGDDGGDGGPRGGGGGGGGGEAGTRSVAARAEGEDVSALGEDVIVLDVGGMSCGGCVASVKRILESQPLVSSASVNLATETAVVWAVPEAKVAHNWKQQLGEKLASHLTTCGFKSNLRGQVQDVEGIV